MKMLEMADKIRYSRMTTAERRETFLLEEMFQPGQLDLTYADLDRTVLVTDSIRLAVPNRWKHLTALADTADVPWIVEQQGAASRHFA